MNTYTADELASMTPEKLEACYWEAVNAVLAHQVELDAALKVKDSIRRERDGRMTRPV